MFGLNEEQTALIALVCVIGYFFGLVSVLLFLFGYTFGKNFAEYWKFSKGAADAMTERSFNRADLMLGRKTNGNN